MIITQFYSGQGLGNQLWMYAVTRIVAESRGLHYGIQSPERFKGRAFLDLDFGAPLPPSLNDEPSDDLPPGILHHHVQPRLRHPDTGADVSPLDVGLWTIADGTKLDGNFESEDYLLERRGDLQSWFTSTMEVQVPPATCVISLRGGEYRYHPDLLLPAEYYAHAMTHVRDRDPNVRFVVVTDDPRLARRMIPATPVLSHRRLPDLRRFGIHPSSRAIGGDFTWLQRARHLILSNSSFSWWGAWTSREVQTVIAPKYWARHNVSDGYWSTGTALTRGWLWQDRAGTLQTYEQCRDEFDDYRRRRGPEW